jgi:hypothetical protein
MLAEKGFKAVRGILTEGRVLGIESCDRAMSAAWVEEAKENHDSIQHSCIIYTVAIGDKAFSLQSAANSLFLCSNVNIYNNPKMAI